MAGIKLIKILRSESRQSQLMVQIRSLLRLRTLQFTHLNAAMTFIFQVLVALFMVTLLYVGVTSFDLTLPTLLILVLIFSRLSPQIREVQNQINNILHSDAVLTNYRDLMRAAGGAREETLSQNLGDKIQFNTSIKLSGVSFSYKTRGIASLRDISIEIPSRKTTAIMGTSGSGKSTLADLIILDEATSALDLENETRIRDTIDKLHDDITVIVIGHRLPTLENSDQLITLEKGRVKSAGSWADIMKTSR